MQSVQSTTETGKLDGIRESEKCIHRRSMCRSEKQGVLSAQLRSPWASQQCVLHILHMPLARCRTMRAEPLRHNKTTSPEVDDEMITAWDEDV